MSINFWCSCVWVSFSLHFPMPRWKPITKYKSIWIGVWVCRVKCGLIARTFKTQEKKYETKQKFLLHNMRFICVCVRFSHKHILLFAFLFSYIEVPFPGKIKISTINLFYGLTLRWILWIIRNTHTHME